MSGADGRVRDVPGWGGLPADARRDLARGGYDEAWMDASPPELRLTALLLYAKLRGMGLWRYVAGDRDSIRGGLHFRCPDLPGFAGELARRRFTRARPRPGYWDSREKRAFASLHVKHFQGWPEQQLQVHMDAAGLWLRWWWWLLPVIPPAVMVLHLLSPRSYRDLHRLRRILIRQGADPRLLTSPEGSPIAAGAGEQESRDRGG